MLRNTRIFAGKFSNETAGAASCVGRWLALRFITYSGGAKPVQIPSRISLPCVRRATEGLTRDPWRLVNATGQMKVCRCSGLWKRCSLRLDFLDWRCVTWRWRPLGDDSQENRVTLCADCHPDIYT